MSEVAQTGVARAEVIDLNAYAIAAKSLQYRDVMLRVFHQRAFGELECKQVCLHAGLSQNPADYFAHRLALELHGRDINRDGNHRNVFSLPADNLLADSSEYELAKRHD